MKTTTTHHRWAWRTMTALAIASFLASTPSCIAPHDADCGTRTTCGDCTSAGSGCGWCGGGGGCMAGTSQGDDLGMCGTDQWAFSSCETADPLASNPDNRGDLDGSAPESDGSDTDPNNPDTGVMEGTEAGTGGDDSGEALFDGSGFGGE